VLNKAGNVGTIDLKVAGEIAVGDVTRWKRRGVPVGLR